MNNIYDIIVRKKLIKETDFKKQHKLFISIFSPKVKLSCYPYLLNEDDKIKLLPYLTNTQKEEFISVVKDDSKKAKIIISLDNDIDKFKYLHLVEGAFYKKKIIVTMSDEYKIKALETIDDTYYRMHIVSELSDDRKKIDFLESMSSFAKKYVLESIKDDCLIMKVIDEAIKAQQEYFEQLIIALNKDENKIKYMSYLDEENKMLILGSFHNEKLKQQYLTTEDLTKYPYLLSMVNDNNLIKKRFMESDSALFQASLISKITDNELKMALIREIKNENLRDIFLQEDFAYKEEQLKKISLPKTNFDIDPEITFGIELEACNLDNKSIIIAKNFSDWEVKGDFTVSNGTEFSSPVFHYNKDDLEEVYYVCDFMKKHGFYTDETCGGHIHIGADYLDDKAMKYLYYIYYNTEDILYQISNRSGMKIREGCLRHARAMHPKLENAIEQNIINLHINNNDSLFVDALKLIQSERSYGLNIRNVNNFHKNTIEFRMPNGEIEYSEIIKNIRLFAKLVEKSNQLSKNPNENDMLLLQQLENIKSSDDKLTILMDLLFVSDEDKNNYIERYNANKTINENIVLSLTKNTCYSN